MFKHTVSELKEALVCLQAGQVTLPYPYQPHPAEEGFRGKPVLNTRKCMCCGACATACPARLIEVTESNGTRTLHFELARCTYCGNCRTICPQEAIEMSPQFELSTSTPEDLVIHATFKLVKCRECGATVSTRRALDLVQARIQAAELVVEDVSYLELCLDCKRKQILEKPTVIREVVR